MSSVEDIEAAVSKLSPVGLSSFRAWLVRFDTDAWDNQFAQDVKAGRLERDSDEALNDLDKGRWTDL
jgi:hypothetical protein